MGIKGCWTCRKRKVRCDLQLPKCGNCTKSRRLCQGYGIQLSWPRDGDKKRAMISRDTRNAVPSNVKGFLNSSSWDVSLSDELENGRISSNSRFFRTMKIPGPNYLSPTSINREQSQLLYFFNESRSLILGPTDEDALVQFILQIAFSDPSDEANPVLQAVFALASLQMHGTSKSFRYKHLVVSAVSEPDGEIGEKRLLQYLMAMMLLYHHELSLATNSKGSWVTFLCTVKRILNTCTSPALQKLARREYAVFLDWIFYHETLAEFTVRHWKVPYQGCGFAPIARSRRGVEGSGEKVEKDIGCPTDVLQLLVHTCRLAIVPQPSESEVVSTNSGIESMNALENRISSAVGDYGPIHVQSLISKSISTPTDRNSMVSDLHRLACLIYVNRSLHRVSGTEFRHRRLVREGILLLTAMGTCQHAWPLFVIACEAGDDEQRLAVLEVFERSKRERRRRSSHLHFNQHLVESVWNQLDLNADSEKQVEYLTIFDAIIGGVSFMPLFA